MESVFYPFEIGQFQCMVVGDGWLTIPDPPPAGGQQDMRKGRRTDISCLLIHTGEHHVLVDTGCGEIFQSTAGKLSRNLKAAGIRREDIDTIIYTHSHLDHVGGTFDRQDQAMFPHARYIMAQSEWECLANRSESSRLAPMFAAARQNLLSIPGQFELVESNTEVLPGITLRVAPGHTPGNTLLEIASDGDRLLAVGDLIHLPVEFTQPDFYSFLDVNPAQAVQNRQKVLSDAASAGRLVFACHFDFPGLGRFTAQDGRFGWQPITGR